MKRSWVLLTVTILMCALAASAETVSVDLNLLPPDQSNRIDMTLTLSISGGENSESDTSTVTGNVTADLSADFDPLTHDVIDINAVAFTGGRIHFSDVSFDFNLGIFGRIEAAGAGIAATPASPLGPGPVSDGLFSTADHVIIVDQGIFDVTGSGVVGGFFESVSIDLSVEPMETSADANGTIAVVLDAVQDHNAVYTVTMTLPVTYDVLVFEEELVAAYFSGQGLIEAVGSFSRNTCTLSTDLARQDCRVDAADLAALTDQWLAYSHLEPCPLSAELANDDCYVDFADFAVLANDWLTELP